MKKRIISLLLALLMVVSILPVPTFAEETDYSGNVTGTAKFNPENNTESEGVVTTYGRVYVTDDPTLGLKMDIDYTLSLEGQMKQTFVIDDYYSNGSGYWYKLAAQEGETLPKKLASMPWVYQNDIPSGTYPDALVVTPPVPTPSEPTQPSQPENPCGCCEDCTGAEGCECQCGDCAFCEKEEEPTQPSQPENSCKCCEDCTGAEGCECLCGECTFCEKKEEPTQPSQPENSCKCCENCTGAEGCECQCGDCDFCEKEEEPTQPSQPENSCKCCENCTGAEGCECQCGDCAFCEKKEEPTQPSQPENPCGCCEDCTGAEGCECLCGQCDFCEKEEEPTQPSQPENSCKCCEDCAEAEGCQCECASCAFKKDQGALIDEDEPEQNPLVGRLVKLIAADTYRVRQNPADWGVFVGAGAFPAVMKINGVSQTESELLYQLVAADKYTWPTAPDGNIYEGYYLDSTKLELIEEAPEEPENPCGCCDHCTGAEGCECECGECDFCKKEEEPSKPVYTDEETGVVVELESIVEGVKLKVSDADVSAQLSDFGVSADKLVFGLDISLSVDGADYQPEGALVKLPVSAPVGTKIGILHTHGDKTTYMGLTKVLSDGTVEFETDGFSEFAGFTVDFHYNGVDFSIEGLTSILLSELFEVMGIDENAFEAKSVVFSDTSLVLPQRQDNGDWLLTSLEAFQTEETLLIIFKDGHSIVIDVTDATEDIYYAPADGKEFTVSENYNHYTTVRVEESNLPITIRFKAADSKFDKWKLMEEYPENSGYYTTTSMDANYIDVTINKGAPIAYKVAVQNRRQILIYYEKGPGIVRVYKDAIIRYLPGTAQSTVTKPGNKTVKIGTWGSTSSEKFYKHVIPAAASALGYTFKGWSYTDHEGNTKTAQNGDEVKLAVASISGEYINFTAQWEPKTNTAYTIKTYQENANDNGYTLVSSENKTGTTDATVSAATTAPTGFTYNASKSKPSGKIAGDGSLALEVYFDRNDYTVTYSYTNTKPSGASDVPGTTTKKFGETVTLPTVTAPSGYTFSGWSTGDATISNGKFTMPDNAVKLSGSWSANTNTAYKIETYLQNLDNNDYSKSTENKTGTTGSTASASTAAPTGFTYNAGKSVASGTIAGDGSLVLKVYFNRNSHTVTYSYTNTKPSGASDVPGTTTKKFGESITLPTVTAPAGYTFSGWSTDDASISNGKFTMPDNAVNLSGSWTPITYKIQFEGGEGATGSVSEITATYDQDVTLPENGFSRVVKVTYDVNGGKNLNPNQAQVELVARFNGWKLENSGSLVAPNTTVKNLADQQNESVTYYADWTLRSTTTPTVERDGYEFLSWANEKAITDIYSAEEVITPSANIKLIAQWAPETYTITYALDGGQLPEGINTNTASYTIEENISLMDAPTKLGYTFTGWNLTAAAGNWTGTAFSAGQNIGTGKYGSVTFTAQWAINSHKVTYSYTGTVPAGAAAVPAEATINFGTEITVAEAPTLAGYTFSGWTVTGAAVTGGKFSMPDNAVTITGQWTPKTDATYTVHYYVENSSEKVRDDKVVPGQTFNQVYTETAPGTIGSYILVGEGTKTVTAGYSNNEITFYYKLNQFSVSYSYTGHTPAGAPAVPAATTETVGSSVTVTNPTLTGYIFSGWVADGITLTDGVFTMPNRAVAFTGSWSADTYTITYDLAGGTRPAGATAETQTYTIEQAFTLMDAPTKTGYKFTGWKLDAAAGNWEDTDYTAGQQMGTGKHGDIKLVAQWGQQYRYALKFDANDGSNPPETMIQEWCDDASKAFTWTTVPVRNGYTFAGWAEAKDSTVNVAGEDKNTYTLEGIPTQTKEKTLYAIWQRQTGSLLLDYSGDRTPVIVTITGTDMINASEKITITAVITDDTTITDLPTGTYTVRAEPARATCNASVTPGRADVESGETAEVDVGVSQRIINWFTGFSRRTNTYRG